MLSLMEVSRELSIPRGVLRACVRDGLLPPAPFTRADLPVVTVAAAVLNFPGVTDAVSDRNVLAVRLARGVLADPTRPEDTWIVVDPSQAWVADGASRLVELASLHASPLLVVPLRLP